VADNKEKAGFEKLVEHEHRITLMECQLSRHDRTIDAIDDIVRSDEHTDSCLDKRLIKIEARQKFMLKVMYMALSSIVFGIGTWIFKSLF